MIRNQVILAEMLSNFELGLVNYLFFLLYVLPIIILYVVDCIFIFIAIMYFVLVENNYLLTWFFTMHS